GWGGGGGGGVGLGGGGGGRGGGHSGPGPHPPVKSSRLPPWPRVPGLVHRLRRSPSPDGEPSLRPAPPADRSGSPPSDIRLPRSDPRRSRPLSGSGGTRLSCAKKPPATRCPATRSRASPSPAHVPPAPRALVRRLAPG